MWGWSWLENLLQDVRHGIRLLAKNPGFTTAVVLTLTFGIGVNTAMFSLVDQLLLWSIPARESSRLVKLEGTWSQSYPFYCALRDRNQVFVALFASSHHLAVGMRPEGAPAVEVGHVHYVSGNYFQGLGIGAAAGRIIVPSDDTAPATSPIAVLSYTYWQRRFAGDLKIMGRKLAVNGYPLEIVGVAEKGFGGVFNAATADAFIPLTMYPVTTPSAARVWNTTDMYWLDTRARLKPGVSIEKAQAGMQVLWPQVVEAVNEANIKAGGESRKYGEAEITLAPGAGISSSDRKSILNPLFALSIGTVVVLLIACGNVANLLLSRATGRRKEIAVRLAVGATRGRLIRQLLIESLLFAAGGGILGLAFAYFGVAAVAKATSLLNPEIHFRPSLAVLAFSAGITALTGLLFGLAPAFRTTRIQLAESVSAGGSATQGALRLKIAKTLIASQVALSLALLVSSGLFLRTLRNLQNVSVGFERENIAVFDIDPSNLGYKGHQLRLFYDQLLERIRGVPGVKSAALSAVTPMGSFSMARSVSAEGYQARSGESLVVLVNPVSSQYFTTLGIPLLLGRDLRSQDEPVITPGESLLSAMGRSGGGTNESPANAARVCIIDEKLARRLFAGANPLGRHLSYEDRYTPESALEIVGVVKDAHYSSVKDADEDGMVYEPSWSNGPGARWVEVRLAGSATSILTRIYNSLRDLDANVPVLRVRMMDEYLNDAIFRERLIAYLSSFFGILALGLASIGLYGVLTYAVSQRTMEMGVRMALGAQRGDLVRMIVRESLAPVLMGLLIGTGAALAFARLTASMLYGVTPTNPASIVAAILIMVAVSLLASAIPARRATKVDPIVALRYE